MLRHLKMELKKQEAEAANQQQQPTNQQPPLVIKFNGLDQQLNKTGEELQSTTKPKRVRGRRSSKPQMEKRRRARINQCLDILKAYVFTDSANLTSLGVEKGADENEEEAIARQILKSSGLINRHRGRKNLNKLEKADILELTVDYVRRLHEQRDKLMQQQQQHPIRSGYLAPPPSRASSNCSSPLMLNLATPMQQPQAAFPSPPPSSASSSPQPLLNVCANSMQVLDLSQRSIGHQQRQIQNRTMLKDGLLMLEGSDGCWRPWNYQSVIM